MSNNLDYLRAFAVLCVYVCHLFAVTHQANTGSPHGALLSSLGRLGVVLFFVHTSYVLMQSMKRTDKGPFVGRFWVRRVFRIYPLAIVVIGSIVLFHIPQHPLSAYAWVGWRQLLDNLTLTQNLLGDNSMLGPMWSLAVEVQMYLLLPGAYLILKGGSYRAVGLLVLALTLGLATLHAPRLSVFVWSPCFIAGVLAFALKQKGRLPTWTWPVGLLLICLLYNPSAAPEGRGYAMDWLCAVLVGLLYTQVKELPPSRIAHWIADQSYGIYLTHYIILWVVFAKLAKYPLMVRGLVLIFGSIVLPWLLSRAIEKPMMEFGKHWMKKPIRTASQCAIFEPLQYEQGALDSADLAEGDDQVVLTGIGAELAKH